MSIHKFVTVSTTSTSNSHSIPLSTNDKMKLLNLLVTLFAVFALVSTYASGQPVLEGRQTHLEKRAPPKDNYLGSVERYTYLDSMKRTSPCNVCNIKIVENEYVRFFENCRHTIHAGCKLDERKLNERNPCSRCRKEKKKGSK